MSEIHYDAIITLGGGSQRGPHSHDLPLWVLRRLELVAHLYRSQKQNQQTQNNSNDQQLETKIICLSAGTPHRPNYIDESSGFPLLESVSAAEYLRTIHKIPCSDMWKETTSLDTIGNAYFLRTSFLDPAPRRKFKRLAIITSAFHMPRTREIFDWILMVDPIAKTETEATSPINFEVPPFPQASSKNSSLFPFSATLFGSSAASPKRNQAAATANSGEKHLYDVVDYFSVSDEKTMETSEILRERIERELSSLNSFRKGIVAKLAPLRENPMKHELFLAAVQDFVLGDHKAYCVHDKMVDFPKKEDWMKQATY